MSSAYSEGRRDAANSFGKALEAAQGRIKELEAERDEWKQQHENLLAVRQQDIAALTSRATAGTTAAPIDLSKLPRFDVVQEKVGHVTHLCEEAAPQGDYVKFSDVEKHLASNAATAVPGDLPIFCYAKQVHSGWPEFNKQDEFSDGEGGGDALVKLADVEKLLASNAGAAAPDGLYKHKADTWPSYDQVAAILHGIDEQETQREDGWWETSTGAEFGSKILAQIRELFDLFAEANTKKGNHG